jgi:hypothetical protein
MEELRQSTAVTVPWGPFVDAADGVTGEDSLTIQKAHVRVKKNGGNAAAASSDQGGSDAGAPHDEGAVYDGAFNTTDTNTLGRLRVDIQKAGAAPYWKEYMVITAEEWDAKYSTGIRQANVTQFGGSNGTFASGRPEVNSTQFAGQTITAAAGVTLPSSVASPTNITAGVITTVTTLTNAPADSSGITTLLSRLSSARAGYLDNLSAGAVALASSLSTLAGKFTGITSLLEILGLIAGKQTGNTTARTELRASGAGSGTYDETTDSLEALRDAGSTPAEVATATMEKLIADHSGVSGSVAERLSRLPNVAAGANGGLPTVNGSNYIAGMQGTINTLDGLDTAQDAQHATTQSAVGGVPTNAEFEARTLPTAEYATAANQTTIIADTNELQTDWANGGRLDLLIDAIKAVVDLLPDAGALSSLAQDSTVAKAALFNSTTRSDPSALAGALASALTPLAKLDWILARVMRENSFNKTTGEEIIKNAAGTEIAKATAADDGTTTTRGAFGAP